jgi:hypothetical protein
MVDMPDLDRLRKAVGTVAAHVDSGDHVWTEAVVMAEALGPLLSLAESGGRLVVEQPCEHGDWDEWPHYTDEGRCSGASRHVVWPQKEDE